MQANTEAFRSPRRVLGWGACLIGALQVCLTAHGDTPESLAGGVIAERRAITTADVGLVANATLYDPDGRPERERRLEMRILADFASGKTRLEHSHGNRRLVDCAGCWDAEAIIRFAQPPDEDGRERSHLEVNFLDDSNAAGYPVPDVRLLGIVPYPTLELAHHNFGSYLGVFAGHAVEGVSFETTVTDQELRGVDCRVLRVTAKDMQTDRVNSRWSAWFSPSHGDGVIRMEVEFGTGEQSVRDELNCELRQEPRSGLWFPQTVQIVRHKNGVKRWEERCEVELRSLNEPLDAELFSLTGIDGVQPGVRVLWSSHRPAPAQPPLVWDGTTITSEREFLRDGILLRAPERPWRVIIIGANIILVIAVTAWLLIGRRRKRSASDGAAGAGSK